MTFLKADVIIIKKKYFKITVYIRKGIKMKNKLPNNAGIISTVVALPFVIMIYMLFGTVDVIFVHEGREVYRQNNVSAITKVEYDCTDPKTGEELEFTYDLGDGETKHYNESKFSFEVSKLVLTNLFAFKWQPEDHVITLEAK